MSRPAVNLAAEIAQAEQFEAGNAPPALSPVEKRRLSNRTRPKVWARKWRAILIDQLGGQCWVCGSRELLCFDHVNGSRTWEMRKFSQWGRIKRIIEEIKAGVKIRLLCKSCNSKDAMLRKHSGRSLESSPLFSL